MEVSFDGYVLTDDLPMVPISALEYWSDGSDYDDDDYDDDEYDYDKNGRRRWKKKVKYKGDDPSKAIDWHKLFPNFDYASFNKEQQELADPSSHASARPWPKNYSIKHARSVFQKLFDRRPGDHADWAYVRNHADCEYYCKNLLESSILPGIVGVDVEMENDSVPFRDWHPRWRTIRAHSRLAKGMFARLLQVANCDGLVVVFDLYALARPHNWEGGIEMDAKRRHWSSPKIPLPTSALPPSLVHFILDPSIVRFGWALHCDWASLYNSFGLLVPQKSYLDAQAPWRYELKRELNWRGNGLADAASALFGIRLDKTLRGYGHFWHGRPPYGKIPNYMLGYAIKDAQTSLDVALQILIETRWLKGFDGVWFSSNVKAIPMPGIRKRIYAWFGKQDKERSDSFSDFGGGLVKEEPTEDETRGPCNLPVNRIFSSDDSGVGNEDTDDVSESGMREVLHRDGAEELAQDEADETEAGGSQLGSQGTEPDEIAEQLEDSDHAYDSMEDGQFQRVVDDYADQDYQSDHSQRASADGGLDTRVVVCGTDRIVVSSGRNEEPFSSESNLANAKPRNGCFMKKKEDLYWKQLPPRVRDFIKACKGEAYSVFSRLPFDENGKSGWSWCPAFTVFRGTMRYKLKRLIQSHAEKQTRYNLKLYRKARLLCDNNLEWAWREAFLRSAPEKGAEKQAPWEPLKTFQQTVLEGSDDARSKYIDEKRSNLSSSFSRGRRGNGARSRRSSGRGTNLLQNIVISSLNTNA